MAIGSQARGTRFTRTGIVSDAPDASGVYALYASGRWVYVGESADIRASLLAHLAERNSCIKRHGATAFVFELVPPDRRAIRHEELVMQIAPVCGRQAR